MTTIADRVTSMKEEELFSVSVIEPLSVSDEVVVVMRVEELLSDFSSHSENGATILSFREAAGAESQFQRNSCRESRGHTLR
jgi:hypothetical protein